MKKTDQQKSTSHSQQYEDEDIGITGLEGKNPPIGSLLAYAGPIGTIPKNYKLCDGSQLDRTVKENEDLFDAIGSSWGGDGVNMFNLPDLQGYFLRGVSAGTGRDPDINDRTASKPGGHIKNDVGSIQKDSMQSHKHDEGGLLHTHSGNTDSDGNHSHPVNINRVNIDGSNMTRDADGGDEKWNADPGFGSINASIPSDSGVHSHHFTSGQPNSHLAIGNPADSGSGTGPARHGMETRPINAYVYWIIRWR